MSRKYIAYQIEEMDIKQIQEQLTYGIKLMYLNKKQQTQQIINYLSQIDQNLLCFITKSSDQILLDLRVVNFLSSTDYMKQRLQLNNREHLFLKDQTDQIILIFRNEEQKQGYENKIKRLSNEAKKNYKQDSIHFIYTKYFLLHKRNKDSEQIELKKFDLILQKLNFNNQKKNQNIIKNIKKTTKSNSNTITYQQFIKFLQISYCRQQLYLIFNTHISSNKKLIINFQNPTYAVFQPLMNLLQFQKFNINKFTNQQIRSFKQSKIIDQNNCLSFFTFCKYINSQHNSINNPNQLSFYSDQHPLNQYYCFSSHNTYLSGNQLTSSSRVQRYIQDLEIGLRCVQLDIHDDHDVPVIKHGYTMTSKIQFEKVIAVIGKYCYKRNHTPIILSFQNRCNNKNKQKMCQILTKYIGSKLLIINNKFDKFPSLKQCRNKIIVKSDSKFIFNKTTEKKFQLNQIKIQFRPLLFPLIQKQLKNKNYPIFQYQKKKKQFDKTIQMLKQDKQYTKSFIETQLNILKDQDDKIKQLSGIFKGSVHDKESKFSECVSINKQKIKTMKKQQIIGFTSRSWLRIYPKGTSFDSSNYNPIPNMQIGAQIIALNSQNKDNNYHILYSHFQQNGGKQSGYVLKPEYLRRGQISSQPTQQTILTIKIFMSINIYKVNLLQVFDYSVGVGFYGSKQDDIPQNRFEQIITATQKVKQENADLRNSRELVYRIKHPYYAFIIFQILKFGKVSIPVRLMRQGYRIVRFLNEYMQIQQHSGLLVHIDLKKKKI